MNESVSDTQVEAFGKQALQATSGAIVQAFSLTRTCFAAPLFLHSILAKSLST